VLPLRCAFAGTRVGRAVLRGLLRRSSTGFVVENETHADLADATRFAPANVLNLSDAPFRGVAVSFGRLFGLSRAGALIVRNAMFGLIERRTHGAVAMRWAVLSTGEEVPHLQSLQCAGARSTAPFRRTLAEAPSHTGPFPETITGAATRRSASSGCSACPPRHNLSWSALRPCRRISGRFLFFSDGPHDRPGANSRALARKDAARGSGKAD